MGCDVYYVKGYKGGEWVDCGIRFSEGQDDTTCLCTFPYNNALDKRISSAEVYSLALLGAATAMAHNGELEEDYNYIPQCVPQWVKDEISGLIRGLDMT